MIRMVYTPHGVIVGEKIAGEKGILALKDPRLMRSQQAENGQIHVDMMPLIGAPKGLEIQRKYMNCDVNDENIIRAYKESCTGLALPKQNLVCLNGGKIQN